MGDLPISHFFYYDTMPTYAEIRRDILITLDQDPDAPGDIYDLVNSNLKTCLYEIISQVWPRELLTKSAAVTVLSSDTELSIENDFLVTDMLKPFTLLVNQDPSNTASEAYSWKYINPELWYRFMDRLAGNSRPNKTFTIMGDNLYIRPWPTSPNTNTAELVYYKEPAAVSDSGIPEFPKQHHSLLKFAVCKQFPQLFSGDRMGLFAAIIQSYQDGLKALLNDLDTGLLDLQITVAPSMNIGPFNRTGISWGGRQTS